MNKPNLTGVSTQMKLDFEQRSGLSFNDVWVHYNSGKPAQLQALAYTQGSQVYVGPGQEGHLPHELGHVVQQMHQKISPTHYTYGLAINSDSSLEKSADILAYQVGKFSGQGTASIQMGTQISLTIVLIIQMHYRGMNVDVAIVDMGMTIGTTVAIAPAIDTGMTGTATVDTTVTENNICENIGTSEVSFVKL